MFSENVLSLINDIEDVGFRWGCGLRALSAVHAALEDGPASPADFFDALYGVYDYLCLLHAEFTACTERATIQGAA